MMKKILSLPLLLLSLVSTTLYGGEAKELTSEITSKLTSKLTSGEGRSRININKNWRFALASKTEKSVEQWRVLDLPHDWSCEGEYSEANKYNGLLPSGKGYYSKDFTLDNSFKNKMVEVQFDGVYRNATVYVNGHNLGTQYDGYVSFRHDITPYIKVGEVNNISVDVDNSLQPNCRWYTGSGIHRHVWLNVTDKLRVETWGTYITTPEVTPDSATVVATTTLKNSGDVAKFILKTTIKNSKGESVASYQTAELVGANSTFDVRHFLEVKNPQLWSVDTPNLYSVESEIIKDGVTVDLYHSTCGIRAIEFDVKRGFTLNGEQMKLKGVCLHSDGGTFGAAVPEQVWEHRLLQLKKLGCNAIRTAHNPPAAEFLDLCDQMGFLVMDEFVDKWDLLFFRPKWYCREYVDPNFRSEWKKNFTEIVRRDRNHPSVIIWSVGNETNDPGDRDTDRLLDEYCSFVRAMDNTRPVTAGMNRGSDKTDAEQQVTNIINSGNIMDIMSANYCEQWIKRMGKRELQKPYVSSESYTYFNSEENHRHAHIERLPWLDVMENDFNMGLFLWVGIDYLGEQKWPKIASNSGLISLTGDWVEKAYLYKALWCDEPTVRIASYKYDAKDFSSYPRNWSWPDITEKWNYAKGDTIDVVTYTNCQVVELYQNGKKIGEQKLADCPNKIMVWNNISYKDGALKAIGKNWGRQVAEFELKSAGKSAKIVATNIYSERKVNSGDCVFVNIEITDSKGVRVYDATDKIEVEVVGGGEVISLHNGDVMCLEPLKEMKSRTPYKGKVSCVVKANNQSEAITLKVTARGLKPAILKIR